jgi:CRISPR-associated protein Cas2
LDTIAACGNLRILCLRRRTAGIARNSQQKREGIMEPVSAPNILEYDFDTEGERPGKAGKYFVLVIYDIIDNKKRTKLAKVLMGFGFRIQKSAFEAMLPPNKYEKMLKELRPFVAGADSIRVYKIRGAGAVTVFGKDDSVTNEEVIVI